MLLEKMLSLCVLTLIVKTGMRSAWLNSAKLKLNVDNPDSEEVDYDLLIFLF